MSSLEKNDPAPAEADPRREILVLEDLSFRDLTRQSVTLRDANLTIFENDLVTLTLPPSMESRAFTSMLLGLRMPQQGRVLFDGNEWTGEDYALHDRMRSQIGRVFDGKAWVENMNIYENVVLPHQHHNHRTVKELDREIQYWSRRFEIESMKNQRPAFVGKTFLRICEWIRALIGSPRLLLLEHPMRSVPRARFPALLQAVVSATEAGAAALWIAPSSDLQREKFPTSARHYQIHDFHLPPVG
ncbi:ATP-binding cassette domain-containing protein [Rosistilla oblonga]|uniref:ATP-binding cassette domain-containing protein n=1 Tax=Rosistilla oblonga TaxID=2527990 RepID=UPI003A96EA36